VGSKYPIALVFACLAGVALALPDSAAGQALPDLQIDYLSLDSSNEITLGISNRGEVAIPAGMGRLELFIEHRRMLDLALAELPDQSFRPPGGSAAIATGVRIGGSQRRVAAFIDTDDEISEQVELQKRPPMASAAGCRATRDTASVPRRPSRLGFRTSATRG
jgi:hypothetical protein